MVLGDDTSCYDYAGHKHSSKRADICGGSRILHSTASTIGIVGPDKLLKKSAAFPSTNRFPISPVAGGC